METLFEDGPRRDLQRPRVLVNTNRAAGPRSSPYVSASPQQLQADGLDYTRGVPHEHQVGVGVRRYASLYCSLDYVWATFAHFQGCNTALLALLH